jgi:hypothetical protein
MSWSYWKMGRAGALGSVVKEQVEKVQGCPTGSAEEAAKNAVGGVLETLCKSFADPNKVVRITAQGSAWNTPDGAQSQSLDVKLETLGDFVE